MLGEKISKCKKKNSLWIHKCWYFNGFLYDSSWRYDLATPWIIFHKKRTTKRCKLYIEMNV